MAWYFFFMWLNYTFYFKIYFLTHRDTVWGVLTGQGTDNLTGLVMHEVKEIETWVLRLLSAPVPVPGKTRVEVGVHLIYMAGFWGWILPPKKNMGPPIYFSMYFSFSPLSIYFTSIKEWVFWTGKGIIAREMHGLVAIYLYWSIYFCHLYLCREQVYEMVPCK